MSRPAQSWIVELRARLAEPPPRQLPVGGKRRAAVLVPLFVDAGELWVLLTRRPARARRDESIAFPGGQLDGEEEAWDAVLREVEEEIALPRDAVLQLGRLDEEDAATDLVVVPCVGAVPFPLEPRLERADVPEVFAVPLTALANPRLVEERRVEAGGVVEEVTVFHVGRRQIWGLTARVLHNLLLRLGLAVGAG